MTNQTGNLYGQAPVQSSVMGGMNYAALAQMAAADRQQSMQRAAAREATVTGGYNSQIATSLARGQQGYDRLNADYSPITADALATRERNMARVDQYGNSLRSDLDIKNRQALAAASQSAIKRGLGNTTIQDSLVRGQNFDNNRQMMTLEDQLLQNRISTDSNLSKTYQDTLQARAQGLASQWNQNTANDNSLASSRLGYIGGIQENDNFSDITNLYAQGLAQDNANRQAELDRQAAMARQTATYRSPQYSMTMQAAPASAFGSYGSSYRPNTQGGFVGGNRATGSRFVG